MKIIKHGSFANATIGFRCRICHCEFEAERHEYYVDVDDIGRVYCTKCPECGYSICADRGNVDIHYNFK